MSVPSSTLVGDTGTCNQQVCDPSVPDSLTIFSLTVYATAAVVGNTMNLIVLGRVHIVTEQQTTLLRILAISDLVSGVQCIVGLLQHCFEGLRCDAQIICKLSGFLISLSAANSSVTLLLIAVDKIVAIMAPLRYPMLVTPSRIKVASLFALCLEMIFLLQLTRGDSFFDLSGVIYIQEYGNCIVNFHDHRRRAAILVFAFLIVFFPAIFLSWAYFTIAFISRRQSQRIAGSFVGIPDMGEELRRREWKGVKLAITITASFLISWLTFTVTEVHNAFNCENDLECLCRRPFLTFLGGMLAMCNSWWNTVVYFLYYTEYRNAAKKVVSAMFEAVCTSCYKLWRLIRRYSSLA